MAKPIPYHELLIPRPGPTLEEIDPQLKVVRRLRLPGIIIPSVGPDVPTAMNVLTPILDACGVTIHHMAPRTMNRGGSRDQPLHIDSIPLDHPLTGMVVQFTEIGSSDISLVKLAQPFCDELRRRNADVPIDHHGDANFELPPDTNALLDEGLIDPDVLQREVYIGSVAAGGAVAFTFGGPHPIAHRFLSTSPERYIQTCLASFAQL